MTEHCRIKVNASKDELQNIIDWKTPETRNEKCLLACILEYFWIVSYIL
jgi:hypothetical protein